MKTTIKIFVSIIMMMLATSTFAQVGDATTINGPTSACANTSAVYSTPPITNATSYMWTIPAGASITTGYGTNVITVQFGTTSGQIMVFGQNGNQFGNGASLNVTVNTAPSVTATATPTDICAGTSTTLTASGLGISSFAWTGLGATNPITVNPATSTTYTVTATGTNGCTSSTSVSVNVHTSPNVMLNLTQDHACTDENTVLLSGGYPTGGTYSCAAPNIIFGGTTIHPAITGVGTWNITYTVNDPYGCSASATDLFTVYGVPEIIFNTISGSYTTSSTPVDLINFVQPTGGVFSGPGVSGTIFDPKVADTGTHMIEYTITHPISGCSATQVQWIYVSEGTGNNTNGVEDVHNAVNKISFPNPVGNSIRLDNIDIQNIKRIEIFTMDGTMEYAVVPSSTTTTIDLSGLKNGIYVLRFVDVDGASVAKRIMKTE